MLRKKNSEIENFANLKDASLKVIKSNNPCNKDYSYGACKRMIDYVINVWIPNQIELSDEEYELISQTIYTLIQDSLESE